MIISCNNRYIMSWKKDSEIYFNKYLNCFFAYRHSSVRNNLKLSTNGRAKTIVGKVNGSSFITGEDIFSIILIDSFSFKDEKRNHFFKN